MRIYKVSVIYVMFCQIVFCNDDKIGLKAIIGIHNTVLGPAIGGTRMWDYISDEEWDKMTPAQRKAWEDGEDDFGSDDEDDDYDDEPTNSDEEEDPDEAAR